MHRLAALCATAALALCAAPTAAAALRPVAPGDDLVITGPNGGQGCTLGYTFTTSAGTTYGLTAGHCDSVRSSLVTDRTSGARGRFVWATANLDDPLATDFGIINFGANPVSTVMAAMPTIGLAGLNAGRATCHTGIPTGVACGALGNRLAATQYTTTGMPRSIPGDSGGPVWQMSARGAVIVGIWLGDHLEPAGYYNGRFTPISDIADQITTVCGELT